MKHDIHNPRRCRIGFGGECRCKGAVIGLCGRCGLEGVGHGEGCDPTAAQYAIHEFLEHLSPAILYVAPTRGLAEDACRRIAEATGMGRYPGIDPFWMLQNPQGERREFTKRLFAATPETDVRGRSFTLLVIEREVFELAAWREAHGAFLRRVEPDAMGARASVVLRGR